MKKEKKVRISERKRRTWLEWKMLLPPSPSPLPIRLGMLHTHLFIALSAISFILLLLLIPPLLLLTHRLLFFFLG